MEYYCASGQNVQIGIVVNENTQDKRWCRVVGFAVAKMSRLSLLLNYGSFPFASLHLTRSFHDRENKPGPPSYLRDYEIIFSQPL